MYCWTNLNNFISLHIIPGQTLMASDLAEGGSYMTANGLTPWGVEQMLSFPDGAPVQPVTAEMFPPAGWSVNVSYVQTDIVCGPGVIHLIDKMMIFFRWSEPEAPAEEPQEE